MLRLVLAILVVIFIVLVATAVSRPLLWIAVIALIVLVASVLLLGGVRTRQRPAERFRHH